jgi:hypothetical protein
MGQHGSGALNQQAMTERWRVGTLPHGFEHCPEGGGLFAVGDL